MTTENAKIRLFVAMPLGTGQAVSLSKDHAHYLAAVMRQKPGDRVALFNGQDGEWQAELMRCDKRGALAQCHRQSKPQLNPPDLWLYFAPIKKTRTDFIVEKATELGASRILPILTDFTNSERVRVDRLQAHAVEAAEQCGGTFVPDLAQPQKLDTVLTTWPDNRALIFCDETKTDDAAGFFGGKTPAAPAAIVIGPEGGFSPQERSKLQNHSESISISLGPRVLRADTAAVAAITLWQSTYGDWK